ncbi:MAG: hypothetical protein LBU09_00260, partial [Endomicrobium sp.]|nr:hypothetical protein [Endomicrobium sp.]
NGTVDVEVSMDKKNSYAANDHIELSSWLFVDTNTFTLQQGETKKVHYKIQTSTSMVGNISGQVSFTTKPPGNEMMRAKMTLPIYVNIRGTEVVDFKVLDVKLGQYFGKTLGTLSIKNNGNIHVMPMGYFSVNRGKKVLYAGTIRQSLVVFAGTTRSDFDFQIPEGIKFDPGKYKMNISVKAKDKESKKTINVRVNQDGSMQAVK